MTVLVAHPTRQHSHRLAYALHSAGLLHSYWTTLPDARAIGVDQRGPHFLVPDAIRRHSLELIDGERVRVLLGPLLLQKIGARFSRADGPQLGELAAWSAFDRWVAGHVAKTRPRVVVGYEMCCARTFSVAKALGIKCVLDAAAFAYPLQDQVLAEERANSTTWAGRRLRRRKDVEVGLADQIICVSDLARRSYVDAGVSAQRITVNPVGCDTALFSPAPAHARPPRPRFAFVGIPGARKGFDLLVDAFERVRQRHPEAELHVVGDAVRARQFTGALPVQLHGKLPQREISAFLQEVDCLVLPSRLESFGMVVVEALACGVPVIVSERVGAAQAVKERENGWVIPVDDAAALTARMLACCDDLAGLRAMRAAAAASAAPYDWAHYYDRAVTAIAPLLQRAP